MKIKHHHYENVCLHDFILGLTEKLSCRDPEALEIHRATHGCVHRYTEPYRPHAPTPLTIKRFFDRMSHFIEKDSIVIAETGVSLFSAAEMLMPDGVTSIGQTFYGSIGYTVGATLGASMAAQDRRTVLFVGDGSFQVTGQDLSTMIRNHLKPIIFLMNNDGYTIERVICDRPTTISNPGTITSSSTYSEEGWALRSVRKGSLKMRWVRLSPRMASYSSKFTPGGWTVPSPSAVQVGRWQRQISSTDARRDPTQQVVSIKLCCAEIVLNRVSQILSLKLHSGSQSFVFGTRGRIR